VAELNGFGGARMVPSAGSARVGRGARAGRLRVLFAGLWTGQALAICLIPHETRFAAVSPVAAIGLAYPAVSPSRANAAAS
jgi:hypothetical protein